MIKQNKILNYNKINFQMKKLFKWVIILVILQVWLNRE